MKVKMGKVHSEHHHIDNGGVSVEIEDKGAAEGVVLSLVGEYYGYPAVKSEINIENLGPEWLKKVGLMFLRASEDMAGVDFNERYDRQ